MVAGGVHSLIHSFIQKAYIEHPACVNPGQTLKWTQQLTQHLVIGHDAPAERGIDHHRIL